MTNSGKVITIFLVIFAILLVSLTAISMFFFQRELELRKDVENQFEQLKIHESTISAELEAANKKIFVLEEKNKEADEKINDLLDDLELEKGLKVETKEQVQGLQKALDDAVGEKEALGSQLEISKARIAELEKRVASEINRNKELDEALKKLKESAASRVLPSGEGAGDGAKAQDGIRLEKIVVSNASDLEGKVLSVDAENEFVIFNLGNDDGIHENMIMTVHRGERYIGDIKVTRVQPSMSAADFIPPLSGRKVRKQDRVRIKK